MSFPDKDDWLTEFTRHLDRLSVLKVKMLDRGLARAKAHCPKCGGKNTLQLALAPSRRSRGALRWSCETEGCHFSGME